jgi:ATP-dependent RNA helicase RhlE
MNKNFSNNRSYSRRKYNNQRSRRSYGNRKKKRSNLNPELFVSKNLDASSNVEKSYKGRMFSEFNLSKQLLINLSTKGFKHTTNIQEKVIEKILSGVDVFAISQTGSGKTGAFLIPMIEKLLQDDKSKVLIIAPTRELAKQIRDEVFSLTKGMKIYSALVIGGESINRQIQNLSRRPQIVVGTPGRLNDVYKRKNINFSEFNNIVVDEVDRLLDMGFVNDIKFIYGKVAKAKQSLFFSATSDKRVEKIIKELTNKFDFVQLSFNQPSKCVLQDIVEYESKEQKIEKLSTILAQNSVTKTLVFVETKRYADKVGKELRQKGYKNGVIHGDKRQNQRSKTMESFKKSHITVLIATNVAARGIDINDISHVINLDTPTSYEEYIHRIGRASRNGNKGTAFTFVPKRGYRAYSK